MNLSFLLSFGVSQRTEGDDWEVISPCGVVARLNLDLGTQERFRKSELWQ